MRTKRFEPKTLAVLLSGLSLSFMIGTAHAARLGELVEVSATGQPLRVAISSPGTTAERIASCLRVVSRSAGADGIPVITQARLSLAGAGQNARVIATHPEPALEPILKLVLQDVCESRLTREYALLLPAPSELSPPATIRPATAARTAPVATTAPRPAPRAGTSAAQTWTTVAGESVASIAQAMYPRDSGARNAFVAGVVRANPDLFAGATGASTPLPAGTRLGIPSLGSVATASTQPSPAARRSPAVAPTPTATPAPQVATSPSPSPDRAAPPAQPAPTATPSPDTAATPADRLVVQQGGGAPVDASALADADELMREEVLVSAIDRTIDTQLELLERLRRLEEIQQALREQLEQEDSDTAQGISATTITAAPVAAEAIEERIPERPLEPAQDSWPEWWREAAGGTAIALLLLLWLLRRRGGSDESETAPALDRPGRIAPSLPSAPPPPVRRANIEPRPAAGQQKRVEPAGRHPETPALEFPSSASPAAAMDESTAMPLPSPEDEIVEEHESAVELADIMVSFGRLHGAAETLAEFIRSNPKQALMPWLKLMDIYRAAGMKPEFDTLARQLNKTFNVKAVTWDNFEAARQDGVDVESMPHILARIQQLWGTRECQAYLETIVRDNRDGTRQGFGLGVIDDILVLSSVLDEQLGRFKLTDTDG